VSKQQLQRLGATLVAAAVLAVGLVPLGAGAADHLDSPTVSTNGATDLNDIYAYSSNDATKSILVATVNPGAGALPNSGTTFGTGVRYNLTVDTNGDATPDITYLVRFTAGNPQGVTIWKNGVLWGSGKTGSPIVLKSGTKLWAGLRDDPFFFDLDAFKGHILGADNGRMLCDDKKVDFFLGLNVSAIVLLGYESLKMFDLVFVLTRGGPALSSDLPSIFMFDTTFRSQAFAQGAAVATIMFIVSAVVIVPYLWAQLRQRPA